MTLRDCFRLTLIVLALTPCARASLLIADEFSTFADGDLVGQHGWEDHPVVTVGTTHLQVSNGRVVIVAKHDLANQVAIKSFTTIPAPATGMTSVFFGVRLSVQSSPDTSASPNFTPTFFLSLFDPVGGFDSERITAKPSGSGFVFGARMTGQATDPYSFGSTVLSFNTSYNVVFEADMVTGEANDVIKAFVNPTHGNPLLETPYLIHTTGAGSNDPSSLGAATISQYQNATNIPSTAAMIESVRVADTFAEAAGIPEPSTVCGLCGLVCAVVNRRVRS